MILSENYYICTLLYIYHTKTGNKYGTKGSTHQHKTRRHRRHRRFLDRTGQYLAFPPYETGQNGGAAFILVYIACVLLLAMPVMIAEFVIGRGSRTNASHAFNKLAPGSWWKLIGYICISAPVIIVGFYFVISGWTLEYVVQSLTPGGMTAQSAEAYSAEFNQFIASPLKPLVWVILFIIINHIILMRGVNSGIEKASNILMPVLFLISSSSAYVPSSCRDLTKA